MQIERFHSSKLWTYQYVKPEKEQQIIQMPLKFLKGAFTVYVDKVLDCVPLELCTSIRTLPDKKENFTLKYPKL